MSHPELEAFAAKFRRAELSILETQHWIWSVRPVQSTLGAGVLSLKRHAANFSDLQPAETADLNPMVQAIEARVKTVFQHDKINYLMLMMNDPHVHFHVMPRYASERTFAERTWSDEGWPALPVLAGDVSDDALLHTLRDALRA